MATQVSQLAPQDPRILSQLSTRDRALLPQLVILSEYIQLSRRLQGPLTAARDHVHRCDDIMIRTIIHCRMKITNDACIFEKDPEWFFSPPERADSLLQGVHHYSAIDDFRAETIGTKVSLSAAFDVHQFLKWTKEKIDTMLSLVRDVLLGGSHSEEYNRLRTLNESPRYVDLVQEKETFLQLEAWNCSLEELCRLPLIGTVVQVRSEQQLVREKLTICAGIIDEIQKTAMERFDLLQDSDTSSTVQFGHISTTTFEGEEADVQTRIAHEFQDFVDKRPQSPWVDESDEQKRLRLNVQTSITHLKVDEIIPVLNELIDIRREHFT